MMAINDDWLVIISNSKQYMSTPYLTDLNCMRQRYAILSSFIAPLVVASLFYVSIETTLVFLIGWSILSGILEFIFLKKLYQKFTDIISARLASRDHYGDQMEDDDDQPMFSTLPFKVFFKQTSFLASLSFTLIQFSSLYPGAIIINYLVFTNTSSIEIALFYSIGSGIGIIALFATPQLIDWFGLSVCSLASVWLVIITLIIGFVQLIIMDISIWLLIAPIAVSRLFMLSFEICKKQIVKESIDERIINQMEGIESQLCHLVTFLTYLIAIMSVSPKNFFYLAIASLSTLFIAGILFSIWYKYHGKDHELRLPDIID